MHTNMPDEDPFIKFFIFSVLISLLFLAFVALIFLSSCQLAPEIARDIDHISTDTAVKIVVSRETFLSDKDLDFYIKINNKYKE